MDKPFNSNLVVREEISEATLKAYHVGFDRDKFRLEPLVEILGRVIPEFALGYQSRKVPITDIVDRIREAASRIYDTDKYKKRGEFGEIILHFLLRDFCNTIPLISKMYFKDAVNVPAHGFDGVQVTIEEGQKKLWLGESKLYKNGREGVYALANDLKKHIQADYLRKEFNLISNKLPRDFPEIEYWRDIMDRHQTLDKIFSSIVIPMVCTYTCSIFKKHCNETEEYIKDFRRECQTLNQEFNDRKIKTSIEVILMLLPVPDKNELNKKLHERLRNMQAI